MEQKLLFPPDPELQRTKSAAEKAGGPITVADMPNNDMKLVAETMGVAFALALMRGLGGLQLSVPKNGLKKVFSRIIRDQYDGSNAKELALRFNLTERYVQQVGNGQAPKGPNSNG